MAGMKVKAIGLENKTIEIDNLRVWKGSGSTLYMKINNKPYTISKFRHPELHEGMIELFRELEADPEK